MKKIGLMVLALAMLLLCACGEDETENTGATVLCEHTYTSKVTKQASCKKEGELTYTCSKCGDSYTETIAKEAHNYASRISKEATCKEEGELTYYCKVCSDRYTEVIPVTDHQFTHASCSEAKTCLICGSVEGTALEHKYENGICKGCAQTDPSVTAKAFGGTWTGYVSFNGGEYYACFSMSENYGLFYGYFFPIEYETEEQLQKILNEGTYTHVKEFDGKYYYSDGGGGGNDVELIRIGATATVYGIIHDDLGIAGIVKFEIKSNDRLELVEVSGDFFDVPEADYDHVIFYAGDYGI